MKKTKENKGISLISLVITVAILLIIMSVSISFLTGENGLLKGGDRAKQQTEISEEKNILKASAISALSANDSETLKEENLRYYLDLNIGDESYTLSNGSYEDSFLVTFLNDGKTGRQYLILGDSTVLESNEDYYIFKLQPNAISSLEIGDSIEISAITNMDSEITWTSSNTNVATIQLDENSNTRISVVAKEIGTSQIIATVTHEGITKTAYCNVEVVAVNSIRVTNVELDKTNEIIDLGTENKTLQLTATTYPEFANKGTELTWTSSEPSVAMVDENGLVTGVSNGIAVITVKTSNKKTNTCVVTVQTTANGIELSQTTATIDLNGTKTLQLTAKTLPDGANINEEITWSSSDTNVATVSETGLVTAKQRGVTTITVKTANGHTASCMVVCHIPISSIIVSPESETLYIGEGENHGTVQLNATVNPENTDENVIWTSSNTSVATVSDSGLVTALNTGVVTIIAKSSSGMVKDTSTITIKGQYQISYDANGGSGAPSSQTKIQGTDLILSSIIPSMSYYTFEGWSTSPNGIAEYQPQGNYTIDADTTLYAIWIYSCETTKLPTFNYSGKLMNYSSTNRFTTVYIDGTCPPGAKSVTIEWSNNANSFLIPVTFNWKYEGNGTESWSSKVGGFFGGNNSNTKGKKTISLDGGTDWSLEIDISNGMGSYAIEYSISATLTFNCE